MLARHMEIATFFSCIVAFDSIEEPFLALWIWISLNIYQNHKRLLYTIQCSVRDSTLVFLHLSLPFALTLILIPSDCLPCLTLFQRRSSEQKIMISSKAHTHTLTFRVICHACVCLCFGIGIGVGIRLYLDLCLTIKY